MSETVLNEYSFLMNLTIKNLEKKDFGSYICTSSNAMGKAEGGVRLQGKFFIFLTPFYSILKQRSLNFIVHSIDKQYIKIYFFTNNVLHNNYRNKKPVTQSFLK